MLKIKTMQVQISGVSRFPPAVTGIVCDGSYINEAGEQNSLHPAGTTWCQSTMEQCHCKQGALNLSVWPIASTAVESAWI
ncbi:hypothetical protein chiPu_0020984 [Chiloscyllium punctatum]|uniref:Uncharacterized protein n=1 Tax=Chiloscyllium punctatum TaxID=137246 RepID=A0A401RLU8_CHIPU|nr:hypothetical protein [Chiloscyllium punctatum]